MNEYCIPGDTHSSGRSRLAGSTFSPSRSSSLTFGCVQPASASGFSEGEEPKYTQLRLNVSQSPDIPTKDPHPQETHLSSPFPLSPSAPPQELPRASPRGPRSRHGWTSSQNMPQAVGGGMEQRTSPKTISDFSSFPRREEITLPESAQNLILNLYLRNNSFVYNL